MSLTQTLAMKLYEAFVAQDLCETDIEKPNPKALRIGGKVDLERVAASLLGANLYWAQP